MEKVSFIDSILKIFKTVFSVPSLIGVLVFSIVLISIISFLSLINSKKIKTVSIAFYIISILLLPIFYFSFYIETADVIIEKFVNVIYFPSCYVYVFILLFTNIDVLCFLIKNIKKNYNKIFVVLNLVYYGLIQFLFFSGIKTILEKGVDIFERAELYSNDILVSFIQVSSFLFWIRILIIIIIKIVGFMNNLKFKKVSNTDNEQEIVIDNSVVLEDSSNNILETDSTAVEDNDIILNPSEMVDAVNNENNMETIINPGVSPLQNNIQADNVNNLNKQPIINNNFVMSSTIDTVPKPEEKLVDVSLLNNSIPNNPVINNSGVQQQPNIGVIPDINNTATQTNINNSTNDFGIPQINNYEKQNLESNNLTLNGVSNSEKFYDDFYE